MPERTVAWETFEWRCGADPYRFEIAQGGLMGTLYGLGGQSMTLPMVAWEGLLDSLRVTRKTRERGSAPLPSRFGARWSTTESEELKVSFVAGKSIPALAEMHGRTRAAIESELARQGLIVAPYRPG